MTTHGDRGKMVRYSRVTVSHLCSHGTEAFGQRIDLILTQTFLFPCIDSSFFLFFSFAHFTLWQPPAYGEPPRSELSLCSVGEFLKYVKNR